MPLPKADSTLTNNQHYTPSFFNKNHQNTLPAPSLTQSQSIYYNIKDVLPYYNASSTGKGTPQVERGLEEDSFSNYSCYLPPYSPLMYQEIYGCLPKNFYTPQKRRYSVQECCVGIQSENGVCKHGQRYKKKAVELDFRIKYKTEMCRNWEEKGFCEFQDSCAFAHGPEELRQKTHIANNYKTKKCASYHTLGYCPYGTRCQFLHDAIEFRRERAGSYQQRLEEMTQKVQTIAEEEEAIEEPVEEIRNGGKNRRRLSTFEQITGVCQSSNDNNSNEWVDDKSTNTSRSEWSCNGGDDSVDNRKRILSWSYFN